MAQTWPEEVKDGNTVAEMLDWVRRRTKGRALFGVMIGANGVVVTKDLKLAPRDALVILKDELETILQAFEDLPKEKVTRKAVPRHP